MADKEREELLAKIADLTATVADLTKQVTELTEALNAKKRRKDSHNSSMPPSRDGYNKPSPKSLRTPSGKNPGGQDGHKGNGMAITMPDEEKKYYPSECEGCPNRMNCGFNCTGTLQNFLAGCAAETTPATEAIRQKVAALNVIHCDETGVDIGGKLNWMHCLCNDRWSYCTVHEKRGSKAMDEIGLIPSLDNCTLVHDFWGAYLKYNNVKHSFCNTHLERELIYTYETTGQKWADELNKLLSEMCGKRNTLSKDGFSCYPPELLKSYFARYDALVEEGVAANPLKEAVKGKRGRKSKGKTRCLLFAQFWFLMDAWTE